MIHGNQSRSCRVETCNLPYICFAMHVMQINKQRARDIKISANSQILVNSKLAL